MWMIVRISPFETMLSQWLSCLWNGFPSWDVSAPLSFQVVAVCPCVTTCPCPLCPSLLLPEAETIHRSFLLWKRTGSACTLIYPGLSWKSLQADLLTKINHPAVSIPSWSFLRVLLSCGRDPTAFTGQLSFATMAAGKCVTVLYKSSSFLRPVVWRCDCSRQFPYPLVFQTRELSPASQTIGAPGADSRFSILTKDAPAVPLACKVDKGPLISQ